jgi:adenine-specific DNA-methyltransferase
LDELKVRNGKLASEARVYSGWANVNKLRAFVENDCNPIIDGDDEISFYLSTKGVIYYRRERDRARNILSVLRNMGTTEKMRSELEDSGIIFQYPKPKELIQYLLRIGLEEGGIVLDFFSGSASTAHAVMRLNAEDGVKRQYIMVQFPELCSEGTVALNSHCKTIADIGRERIRRVGDAVRESVRSMQNKGNGPDYFANTDDTRTQAEQNPFGVDPDSLDIGFKAFRIEDTKINWIRKDLKGEELTFQGMGNQDELGFVPGFTDEDIVYEVMLRQSNIPLTEAITQPVSGKGGKRTYLYGASYLICLEETVTRELIETLASLEPTPLKYIFRDSAFGKDIALKDETFRRLNAEIARNHGEKGSAYTVEFL